MVGFILFGLKSLNPGQYIPKESFICETRGQFKIQRASKFHQFTRYFNEWIVCIWMSLCWGRKASKLNIMRTSLTRKSWLFIWSKSKPFLASLWNFLSCLIFDKTAQWLLERNFRWNWLRRTCARRIVPQLGERIEWWLFSVWTRRCLINRFIHIPFCHRNLNVYTLLERN